ncbi:MAG: hypothetical protein AB7I27_01090 [Bacteriovoracaceae bacterium]
MGIKTSKNTKSHLQTFTYFIPAPPHRKSGYREIEFDKIMTGILRSGFQLLEMKTEAVNDGIFIIALLKGDAKASKLDKNFDIQNLFALSSTHASSDIILDEE